MTPQCVGCQLWVSSVGVGGGFGVLGCEGVGVTPQCVGCQLWVSSVGVGDGCEGFGVTLQSSRC